MNKRIVGQDGLKTYKIRGALARSSFALAGSSALTLILMSVAAQAQTIVDGQTETTTQTVSDGATLTIESGGKISVTTGDAVYDGGTAITFTINNAGTIETSDDKGIDAGSSTLIVNNSGTILGDDDGLRTTTLISLTNSGSISGRDGVEANIITNLINSGTITGNTDAGIEAGTITKLVNNGTITGDDDGISSSDTITSLTNSGTIIGNNGEGVNADDLVSLINSGTIIGANGGVEIDGNIESLINSGTITGGTNGVEANDDIGSLINSGTITGGADGIITFGDIVNLINSGTISGGTDAIDSGIQMETGTIVNSGIITGFKGIVADGDNAKYSNIINSGTISSKQAGAGIAIEFNRADNPDVVSLNAGSILVGTIDWDGANDTLNMGTGLNAIVYFSNGTPVTTNFSSPLNASGADYRAQVDFSSAAAMGTMLDDIAGGIGGVVRTRMDTVFLPLEQGAADFSATKTAWTSGWGAYSSIEGTSSTATTTHGSIGSLFALDWSSSDGPLYGFYGGAGVGQVNVDVTNGHKTSTTNYYGGVYGLLDMYAGTVGLNITGGIINFDSQRTFADSSLASGIAAAQADYKGWFIAPTLSYSKDHQIGEKTLISTFSVGYQGLFTQGYSETGSNANVSVNARNIHQVTARAEVALQQEKVLSSGTVLNFAPFMGAEGRIGVGSNNVTASLLGNTATFNPGGDKSVGRGFVGAKFTAAMSNTKSLFGKIEGSWDSSNTKTIAGNIGFAVKF